MWTIFWDMHSGGGSKEKWEKIYIEATEDEAIKIFYNRFGHNPFRVSCTCCGEDYSVTEYKTLGEATDYHRRNSYNDLGQKLPKLTVKEYGQLPSVLYIRKSEIKPHERKGEVPSQGFVWVD